ncbi:LysR substrate-binding domain-containing protein [Phaeobacter sp. HF9A]|uniref:LysR substrate-binding domain-containing protein n=1 Tax=Phaeobacter sp. HF9A TaxID=2721561 RepID=UPI0014319741|nr:LysR substrate-binding domain-containing protein [Phaeobacter sp. HF9A]NIZ12062.1 LysR family transcriptional regulator [Phaeobacter sp. HF9A]
MRQLEFFLEVANCKSVTKAAQALHTAQPNVSRTIRELEHLVGNRLFERSNEGVSLTPAGQALYTYVRSGIAQIEQAFNLFDGTATKRTLAVMVAPSISRSILPGVTQRFKKMFPHVTPRVMATAAGDMTESLRNGDVDLLVGRQDNPKDTYGVSFHHLYNEPLLFVVRKDHQLAEGTHGLDALCDFTVMIPNPGVVIRDELDHFIMANGARQFPNTVETMSFDFIRAMLATSDMVAFCPEGVVRAELGRGDLVAVDIEGMAMMGSIGIATIGGTARLPTLARAMMACFEDEVRAQGLE